MKIIISEEEYNSFIDIKENYNKKIKEKEEEMKKFKTNENNYLWFMFGFVTTVILIYLIDLKLKFLV